jgi:hypothetical protein
MNEQFKKRIELFYSELEKINLEIEKLEKSKTSLYWSKSIIKTELEIYYHFMIGKKANCKTENGCNIYECTKVLISDDFKPLPRFSNSKGKKVCVIDFDWL